MNIQMFTNSIIYVMSDPFFWPSMSFTTMVGIFIGAVIHDGDTKQLNNTLLSLAAYGTLILVTNLTRVLPLVGNSINPAKPLASIATTLLVSIFYLLGLFIGVKLVEHARHKVLIKRL